MAMIGIGIGDATMGRRQVDAAGNVVSETPAQWTENPAGGCVCLWPMDPETQKPAGAAELFGDWDAAGYLARVLELIHPNRQINVPDLPQMIFKAAKDGVDLCEYCPTSGSVICCRDCIINDWKDGNMPMGGKDDE